MMRRSLVLIIILAILLCSAKNYFAATPQQMLGFPDLTFELSMAKEMFVQCEPIPISLKLSNKTNQPILGHKALEISPGLVRLIVTHDNNSQEITRISGAIINTGVSQDYINPNEVIQIDQIWASDLNTIFSQPGIYQIQAILNNVGSTEVVKSNTLTIRIMKPIGRDLKALNFINQLDIPFNFFSEMIMFKREVLEEFVIEYGDTAYGDYAELLLANSYYLKKDYDRASEQLEKIVDKVDFKYGDVALYYLVESNLKTQNLNKSRGYFKQLKDRYPQSIYINRLASPLLLNDKLPMKK